jgi:hypothetical protein
VPRRRDRLSPYRTPDERIDGVVLTFVEYSATAETAP